MKKVLHILALCTFSLGTYAQGVGINTTGAQPDQSAALDLNFNNKGLLIPRMTESERNSISNPALGLQIFNTDTKCVNLWVGTAWKKICGECDFNLPQVSTNAPLCMEDTLQLSATFESGLTYSWTGPNGFSSSLQSPSIPNVTTAADGVYFLVVSQNGCFSSPISTTVTVNTLPGTPVAGANSPLCEGDNLQLTASNIANASYQWSGPNAYSANTQNPVILNVNSSDAGTYSVFVTDVNGCTSSSSDTIVTVDTVSPAFTFSPPAPTVGAYVTFSPAVSGANSYAWTFQSGDPASSAAENPSVRWSADGTFNASLTITGNNGCVNSSSQAVTVDPFGPDSIAGLQLWLDASAISGLSNGNNLNSWLDLSGNGRNATSTSWPTYSTNALNGKPVVHFTPSQNIRVTHDFGEPFTVLYVGRQNGSTTRERVMTGVNNNWLLGWWQGGKAQAYFSGWVSNSGTPAADNAYYLYTGKGTGSLSTLYENGVQQYQNNGGVDGPNGIAINTGSFIEQSTCDIAEIIIYNSALSDNEREAVEAYLNAKWGL